MSGRPAAADSTIVNLYYAGIDRALRFWHDGLGFAVVLDQGWAKLLRLADRSFLGLVGSWSDLAVTSGRSRRARCS